MDEQGDGMPADRLKAHELFQAWEEQCAESAADSSVHEIVDSCATPTLPAASLPTRHPEVEAERKNIRENAELSTQVDNVRQRIAKLSLQLQSPAPKAPAC
jgi:hypothetical protein